MFDPSIFMQAFEAHGLVHRATRASVPGDTGFLCGFVRPDELILGDDVHAAGPEIEFETAAAPGLVRGQTLTINGQDYRLVRDPRRQGDGYFSRAVLKEI
ncbi:hypothetical protein AZ34_11880 [Hylemonella gracilis str. Niagara R]|uniref:Uncharacterized protein n=1 Tax=Hylemonella gracilis str. Niagara R TaxID=1458275 RepID=A0A016XKF7_9BURK|nr:hypothetical protein [Hylemonella gracilis]EYC51703.1 hypothetical protein AZ34_11880 [Hylemonella gracilis str. Niagara R]